MALGVPDAGGRFIRRLGQSLPTKRRAVNAALAVWAREGFEDGTRPELFINTSALLPHGPRSRHTASVSKLSPKMLLFDQVFAAPLKQRSVGPCLVLLLRQHVRCGSQQPVINDFIILLTET